jgi:hypothetical protein
MFVSNHKAGSKKLWNCTNPVVVKRKNLGGKKRNPYRRQGKTGGGDKGAGKYTVAKKMTGQRMSRKAGGSPQKNSEQRSRKIGESAHCRSRKEEPIEDPFPRRD